MITRHAIFAGMLVAAAAVTAGGAANAPSMSVNWVEVNGDQDDCVKQASRAVKANNFGTRFEVISNRTIYGGRGAYTAAVRCVADKSIAFVAVAGPDSGNTEKYASGIRDAF